MIRFTKKLANVQQQSIFCVCVTRFTFGEYIIQNMVVGISAVLAAASSSLRVMEIMPVSEAALCQSRDKREVTQPEVVKYNLNRELKDELS